MTLRMKIRGDLQLSCVSAIVSFGDRWSDDKAFAHKNLVIVTEIPSLQSADANRGISPSL
jgi:hypothetical protein